jgi:hypothetical protein
MTNPLESQATRAVWWPRILVAAAVIGVVGLLSAKVVSNSKKVEVTLAAGTTFIGALQGTVSTEHASVGDRVEIRTTDPIAIDGQSALPAGAVLRGEVTHSEGGGRISGAPELTIRFTNLDVDGGSHAITTEPFTVKGKSDAKESALEIGGGAVVGGVVGAVTGNVVRGAVVGAVLGTGVAVVTEGDDIVLTKGQKLRVRLRDPVTISYRPEATSDDSPTP